MNYRNRLNRWNVILLSAVNGLFSSAIFLMAWRAKEDLAELAYQRCLDASHRLYQSGIESCCFEPHTLIKPFGWVKLSILQILIFIIAGLLTNYLLAKRIRSAFLLWQCVGLTVITMWGILILFGFILYGSLSSEKFSLESVFKGIIEWLPEVAKFMALILGVNVLYGAIMQIAAKQYSSD